MTISNLLAEVIEINIGYPLNESDRDRIMQVVNNYGLDGDWIRELLSAIVNATSGILDRLHDKDASKLGGALAELEEDYLVNFKDCGEVVRWKFNNGVELFIFYEGSPITYQIRQC